MSDEAKMSFKIERSLIDQLATIAKKGDRSLSAQVRIAIREHIAKENGNGNA